MTEQTLFTSELELVESMKINVKQKEIIESPFSKATDNILGKGVQS
ncbi:hypothetical protein ACWV26_09875 [Rummeliibacillus sp. JY-2-4R]